MQKIFVLLFFITHLLYSATIEQVEEYLSVSTAEEELLLLESQYSSMQNSFSSSNEQKESYDMQLLTVRFKEYLQRNLSNNEIEEILENYKKVIYLQFVSTTLASPEQNETEAYIETLEKSEEAGERLDILEEINKALNNKESMLLMFDNLMKPFLQNAKGANNMDEKTMEKRREAYARSMIEQVKKETLYNLKDFTVEELKELLKVLKTPAVGYEVKAVYGATAYALKEFFLSLANRYDISKHEPQTETNATD
jgi:hypothetical protein